MPHFKALAQNGDEERLASRNGFCISAPRCSLIENNEGLFIKLEVHLILGHYISARVHLELAKLNKSIAIGVGLSLPTDHGYGGSLPVPPRTQGPISNLTRSTT